jgi:hypothetical protein
MASMTLRHANQAVRGGAEESAATSTSRVIALPASCVTASAAEVRVAMMAVAAASSHGRRVEGEVGHVRLARPEKRNALNAPMADELDTATDALESLGVSVGTLSGAGPLFCAGADLAEPIVRPGGSASASRRASGPDDAR